MNSTSKFVKLNETGLASALVMAFEQWTTPFDIKPNGVFGSIAMIKSGNVTLSSEALDIDFSVPF